MSDQPDPGNDPTPRTVRCPTCRAIQEWSDTCRRCKSDLRLLRAFAVAYEHSRRACLEHLRAGRPRSALEFARQCQVLRAGAESGRLLAVTALLCGDHATALSMARRSLRDDLARAALD